MKKSHKRLKRHKKRYYTRKNKKSRGGKVDYTITNPTVLVKQKKYLIKFYNDEDNNEVESDFSPTKDGIYTYIEYKNLYPYHSNKQISYYIFERNGEKIYLFYDGETITYNNITTYYQMPVYYGDNNMMHSEKPNYRWSDDYYNEYRQMRYRCNIYKLYTKTDLLNVSRVARLKKNLPIEMERTIQSFMVGND